MTKSAWRTAGLLVAAGVAGLLCLVLVRRSPTRTAPPDGQAATPSQAAPHDGPDLVPARAPEREARPASENLPPENAPPSTSALRALEACFTKPAADLLSFECARGMVLGPVTPEELGEWLCDTDLRPDPAGGVLARVFLDVPPAAFLSFIDALQLRCDRHRETPILLSAMGHVCRVDPAWCQAIQDRMLPGALFAARSEAPVQLAEYFLGQGDGSLRQVLEDGARGLHGGSPRQMHRAALVVAVNSTPGRTLVSFLESLVDSARTTAEGHMGGLLAQFLVGANAEMDGSHDTAIQVLERVLQDERFAFDAANQLLAYFADDPRFLSGRWKGVMDMARMAARR